MPVSGVAIAVELDDHLRAEDRVPDLQRAVGVLELCGLEPRPHVAPARRQVREHSRRRPPFGLSSQRGRDRVQPARRRVGRRRAELDGIVALQEPGVGAAVEELGMAQHPHEQVAVGGDAVHLRGRERFRQPPRRVGARGPPRDDLGEHRVVERADDRAVLEAGVDAHAVGERDAQPVDRTARGQEARGDVLCVQPRFDRVAVDGGDDRVVGERLTLRDEQLHAHEVEAGDHLGDGVLHLQARVHLEEEELALLVHHELDRACAHVPECLRRRDGRVAERVTTRRSRPRVTAPPR